MRAPDSPGQFRYLISRGSHGCIAGSYGLYTAAAGGIAFYVFDGARYVVSATASPADVWNGGWHHVAGTFDGRAVRVFVDGRPVGEPMDAPLRIDYAGTSALTTFGRYAGGCGLGFTETWTWCGCGPGPCPPTRSPRRPPAPRRRPDPPDRAPPPLRDA